MSAKSEIDYLANYIMENVPGEPSQSEGAGHCAVRIINNLYKDLELANEKIKKYRVFVDTHSIVKADEKYKGYGFDDGACEHEPDCSEGEWK